MRRLWNVRATAGTITIYIRFVKKVWLLHVDVVDFRQTENSLLNTINCFYSPRSGKKFHGFSVVRRCGSITHFDFQWWQYWQCFYFSCSCWDDSFWWYTVKLWSSGLGLMCWLDLLGCCFSSCMYSFEKHAAALNKNTFQAWKSKYATFTIAQKSGRDLRYSKWIL